MGYILLALLMSAVITVLLEWIPALFMQERQKWMKASAFCNIITNPILNLSVFFIITIPFMGFITVAIIVLEIAVVLFESYLYRKMLDMPKKKCMVYSIIANILSLVLGSVLLFFLYNFLAPERANSVRPIGPNDIIFY